MKTLKSSRFPKSSQGCAVCLSPRQFLPLKDSDWSVCTPTSWKWLLLGLLLASPSQSKTGRFLDLGRCSRPARLSAFHATAHTNVASCLTTTRLSWEPLTDGPGSVSSLLFFLLHDAPGGFGLFHRRTRYCCFVESCYQNVSAALSGHDFSLLRRRATLRH